MNNTNYLPYLLGRLFCRAGRPSSSAANPGINTTIKDKYFNSASATPATIFPILINLAQKHLKKLDTGLRSPSMTSQLGRIWSSWMTETLPARLTLPEQGVLPAGLLSPDPEALYSKEGGK